MQAQEIDGFIFELALQGLVPFENRTGTGPEGAMVEIRHVIAQKKQVAQPGQ